MDTQTHHVPSSCEEAQQGQATSIDIGLSVACPALRRSFMHVLPEAQTGLAGSLHAGRSAEGRPQKVHSFPLFIAKYPDYHAAIRTRQVL